jgi:hypothetical protein
MSIAEAPLNPTFLPLMHDVAMSLVNKCRSAKSPLQMRRDAFVVSEKALYKFATTQFPAIRLARLQSTKTCEEPL